MLNSARQWHNVWNQVLLHGKAELAVLQGRWHDVWNQVLLHSKAELAVLRGSETT